MLIPETQLAASLLKLHYLKCTTKKNETRKGQKSQVYHHKKKLGFLTKLKSCNESQVGKNEDDLFGQIITKFLRKISN